MASSTSSCPSVRGTSRPNTWRWRFHEAEMHMTRTQRRRAAHGRVWVGGICGLCAFAGFLIHAQNETRSGEWRSTGGDSAYQRYSPLAQITRDNVKNLRVVWRRPAVDPKLKEQFPKLR